MGFKMAPQIIGLIRGEPKGKGKHRAPGDKILEELGEERKSRSKTLDRERSKYNRYAGYRSGAECWAALQDEADQYRTPVVLRDGRTASRGLRRDAILGIAVIYNPPAAATKGWTDADYTRFYKDCREVMADIEPRLFGRRNSRMLAEHRDEDGNGESRHIHEVLVPRDGDGRYCGNLLDAQTLARINQEFPRRMRARGWGLEDLDTTDWKRYKADPSYREIRDGKRGKSGRSVNKYLDDLRQDMETREKALTARERALEARERALADREAAQAMKAPQAVPKAAQGKPIRRRLAPAGAKNAGMAARCVADAEEMAAKDNPTKMSGLYR